MVSMRFVPVVALVCLVANAAADKKIVDMTPGFERELAACEMQEGGLGSMLSRAKDFVAKQNPPDKSEIEKDIEKLAKSHASVTAYCAEVKAMVQLLKDNAQAAYKTVQKDIDARDATVRKARKEGKKQIEEAAPITRKLIPRVNSRAPQIEEKKQTAKFPSGRVVELPSITGSWKMGGNLVSDVADYSSGDTTATVTSRPFSNATCDQQKKMFASKAGDEPIADLALSDAAKAINVQWAWRYVRRDQTPHMLTMMCVTSGTGGFVAIADLTPPTELAVAEELSKLMVTMLQLQLKN